LFWPNSARQGRIRFWRKKKGKEGKKEGKKEKKREKQREKKGKFKINKIQKIK
jgi:hypothetical protein